MQFKKCISLNGKEICKFSFSDKILENPKREKEKKEFLRLSRGKTKGNANDEGLFRLPHQVMSKGEKKEKREHCCNFG